MREPAKWPRAKLSDLSEPTIDQRGPEAPHFIYIDIGSIDRVRKLVVEPKLLAREQAPTRARQRLRTGDVVLSMTRPNLNAVALVPPDLDGSIGSTGFHVLRARSGVRPQWLYYAVQTSDFVQSMCARVQGALYPAVRPKDIAAYEIPVPDEEIQDRVIADIEKQFTRLETGVAALLRVQRQLRRYRASAVDSLFRGTESVPREVELGRLIVSGPQNGVYLPKAAYGSGTPILRIEDYQNDWSRSAISFQRVRADSAQIDAYSLELGDLVINRVNSPTHLGKVLCIQACHLPAIFESNMMRVRVGAEVSPDYVALFLRSHRGRERLLRNAKWAVNQASINQQDVGATMIPVVPREEQDRIVAMANDLCDVALRQAADGALHRASALRQSVLRRAFGGQVSAADLDQRGVVGGNR